MKLPKPKQLKSGNWRIQLRFRDRINMRKIVEAALASFAMLEGAAGRPLNEDWNFKW